MWEHLERYSQFKNLSERIQIFLCFMTFGLDDPVDVCSKIGGTILRLVYVLPIWTNATEIFCLLLITCHTVLTFNQIIFLRTYNNRWYLQLRLLKSFNLISSHFTALTTRIIRMLVTVLATLWDWAFRWT